MERSSTDDEGYKSVAYGRLVAPLIEAVKKQQEIITGQQGMIAVQERVNAEQQEAIARLGAERSGTPARLARIEALLNIER